ncbi:alcohol acetyltransferase-domain-containing protein [Hypoxylon sp. FL1284]|nr:alcohol acetyltransferase-domain-containing protein [Hypoxylon sp. FL1284]
MQTLDQYRGTIIACRYSLPSDLIHQNDLAALRGRVYDAVARVVRAQPLLQVGIVGENTKDPVFVRLDRLDLRKHVDWRSIDDSGDVESQYLALIQSQLDVRYTNLATQPGWRVVVLHKVEEEHLEILYVWNHVYNDGMSGKIFHEQLLRNLNREAIQGNEPQHTAEQGSNTWILDLPDSSATFPPNPESLSPWPISSGSLLKSLWRGLKPFSISPASETHATWAPIQAVPYGTRLHSVLVNRNTITKVVDACRQYHTTLTGLLHALMLLSLSSALEQAEGFESITPYDLRHFLPSNTPAYPWLRPKETMCNYLSVIGHVFDAELVAAVRSRLPREAAGAGLSADVMDLIWSVSARVRREIKARLDSGVKNDMIGTIKSVRDWRAQKEGEARKPRHMSWLVTNLGVLDGEASETRQGDHWSIRRAGLFLSAEVPSAAFSLSVMTVKGEQMCVSCSWQDVVVDDKLGKRLMGDLERWFGEIAS